MHLSDIMPVVDYSVTGGSEYLWACFGPARYMEFESDYCHISIIFSTDSQRVLEVTTCPKTRFWAVEPPPYRYIDPAYKHRYVSEATSRNIDPDVAWDDVKYVMIETEDDILEKVKSMFEGDQNYDRRIVIPIDDIPDDIFLAIAHMAHDQDITINTMFEQVLRKAIDDIKKNGLSI